MRFFPIFVDTKGKTVVVSGAGHAAEAKLRLLLKTDAKIFVYGNRPTNAIRLWAQEGRLVLQERAVQWDDVSDASLVYGANDNLELDQQAVALGKWAGALTNIVDNLEESEFLTPAIVDRDPVTVAIGTEGTAPVLARKIKVMNEEFLSVSVGKLAKIAGGLRHRVAHLSGVARRKLWSQYYSSDTEAAFEQGGEDQVADRFDDLVFGVSNQKPAAGKVIFVGAGPGDPDLMTLKARKHLDNADVVLHDRLVSPEILELARREALIIETGKKGFGPSFAQDEINRLMVKYAREGHKVVRLKGGDPAVFGRLAEEIDALDEAQISFEVVPGITAASAGAAAAGVSLTKRGRNESIRIVTGHDLKGFNELDWQALAQPNAAAAIYMGVKASSFIAGRLLMHGANPLTPITVVASASRKEQKITTTTLAKLPTVIGEEVKSPAILLFGLARSQANLNAATATHEQLAGAL